MAKSLRSKRKRKMRAIKRVKYSEKELNKLNLLVAKAEAKHQTPTIKNIEMKTIETKDETKDEVMSTNQNEVKRNPKTMKDQFGHYPVWMNQRRVKRLKDKLKSKKVKRK